MALTAGTQLGRYEIRSQLGAGGMGEVYFARDTRLGRPVALKLLSAEFTTNKDRLRRFEQEARATSALNHPNIITIHEIGQADTTHYIATEFIDGVTLRQHMARTRMKITEVLDVAIQVAAALTAAHAAGIVHRDIKPENIMLRTDSYVKVLDFGLAKLTENLHPQFAGPEASTATNIDTDPGAIIGTIVYMSPEQLRGQMVDGRTDIWSLGVVIYEMLTGHVPFEGSTKSDVIVSILEREPPPLTRYASGVHTELQRIVAKALRKDKEERYQTAKELLVDLRNLKQDLDFEARSERSAPPAASSEMAVAATEGEQAIKTAEKLPHTDEVKAPRLTLSVNYLASELKRHKGGALVLLMTLMIAVAGVAYWLSRSPFKHESAEPLQKMKFTPLIRTGNVRDVAISPDGKYVAYVIETAGQQSLWVRQIATSSDVQKVAPTEGQFKGLTFSRNSGSIYYLKQEHDTRALYQIPVLGGDSRKVMMNVSTPITFSPDGKRLAFVRKKDRAAVLTIANSDGTGEQALATSTGPDVFITGGIPNKGPAWSPDGTVIACPTYSLTEPFHMDVVGVRVEDGFVKKINAQPWYFIGQVAWLSDGSGLVMNAEDQALSPFQIWRLSYPSGEAHRITNDPNFYEVISMTDVSQILRRA